MSENKIIKCRYALDPEDEYCKDCNGITMMIDGVETPCTKCAGYEADTSAEAQNSNVGEEKVEVVKDTTEEIKTDTDEISTSDKHFEIPKGVKVKSIRYMSGCTVRKSDDVYYKFTAEEEWETSDEADVEEVRKALWDKLDSEIDKKVEEVLK